MTTYEDARRCPRCEHPGEHVAEEDRPLRSVRGAKLIKIYCRQERCKWFNTAWTVQVNADGSIPPENTFRDKKFPELPSWGAKSVEALESQLRLETTPGAELNNPH